MGGSSSSSPSPHSLALTLLVVLLRLISLSSADHPPALVVPVSKDTATKQYVARVSQRTPLVALSLVVDLGSRFLWVECSPTSYVSSTYRPARCRSAQCALANAGGCSICFSPPSPGCNENTCSLFPENPFISTSTSGELASDVLSLSSTYGSNPGPAASDPNFLFSCAPSFLLQGLANGAKGIAALGRTKVALPSQLAAQFSFESKFAICLSSSKSSDGVIFFGDGQKYLLLPNIDASQSLTYTRLLVNPVSTAGSYRFGERSADYFIGVKEIRINKAVAVNTSLLLIGKDGVGGTKISTVVPYTVMETSIYKAVIHAFSTALSQVKRAKAVAPFELCFDSKGLSSTRVGPGVPQVELVMQDGVIWRIFGANSMVQVSENVLCLGFINGGVRPRTSIVIGGYQLEDNLLEFDLARSRLGFTSTLFFQRTTCGNFNFTSNA